MASVQDAAVTGADSKRAVVDVVERAVGAIGKGAFVGASGVALNVVSVVQISTTWVSSSRPSRP